MKQIETIFTALLALFKAGVVKNLGSEANVKYLKSVLMNTHFTINTEWPTIWEVDDIGENFNSNMLELREELKRTLQFYTVRVNALENSNTFPFVKIGHVNYHVGDLTIEAPYVNICRLVPENLIVLGDFTVNRKEEYSNMDLPENMTVLGKTTITSECTERASFKNFRTLELEVNGNVHLRSHQDLNAYYVDVVHNEQDFPVKEEDEDEFLIHPILPYKLFQVPTKRTFKKDEFIEEFGQTVYLQVCQEIYKDAGDIPFISTNRLVPMLKALQRIEAEYYVDLLGTGEPKLQYIAKLYNTLQENWPTFILYQHEVDNVKILKKYVRVLLKKMIKDMDLKEKKIHIEDSLYLYKEIDKQTVLEKDNLVLKAKDVLDTKNGEKVILVDGANPEKDVWPDGWKTFTGRVLYPKIHPNCNSILNNSMYLDERDSPIASEEVGNYSRRVLAGGMLPEHVVVGCFRGHYEEAIQLIKGKYATKPCMCQKYIEAVMDVVSRAKQL